MTIEIKKDLAEQLAHKIIDSAKARAMLAGEPLREETFAKEMGVSRSPIRRVFALLEECGLVTREPNRGYFLSQDARSIDIRNLPLDIDPFEDFYLKVVDDVMIGEIGSPFFEAELKRRYGVPRGQLMKVLNRLANEAMIERKAGQGWVINRFLHTAEAQLQSYRFRMAVEPAALLEPTYRVNKPAFAEARRIQQHMLGGGLFEVSRAEIFQIGAQLHELIVGCSGNPLFLESIRRQNQLRRFMAYRSNFDRPRLVGQCEEHIQILDLIEGGKREEAAELLRQHLDVVSQLKDQAI